MQNFVFGDIGFKILVWKNISSHTHAFLVLNFNALSQIFLFFKNCVFPENLVSLCLIRSVHPVFRPIEILKILIFFKRGSLCLFRLVETDFRPIETRVLVFLKSRIGLFQSHYSNFFKLFSLSALALGSTIKFLSFSFKIFTKFLSLEDGKTLLPFFFKFISCFHAFFMHSHSYFRHLQNYWGF